MTIEGVVARILDEQRVVVNRGSAAGVRDGTVFVIFTELDEVPDPETGESLGKLEIVKARVRAAHVQEKMSICVAAVDARSAREDDPTQHTLSAEMVAVSLSNARKAASLNVDRGAMRGMPQVGPIAVGDRVRSVE